MMMTNDDDDDNEDSYYYDADGDHHEVVVCVSSISGTLQNGSYVSTIFLIYVDVFRNIRPRNSAFRFSRKF